MFVMFPLLRYFYKAYQQSQLTRAVIVMVSLFFGLLLFTSFNLAHFRI